MDSQRCRFANAPPIKLPKYPTKNFHNGHDSCASYIIESDKPVSDYMLPADNQKGVIYADNETT
jgi:hypothetical protein